MKKYLIALSLAVSSAFTWALPTVAEVEAQVQQGHYTQAESMMKEVVDAKPGSAKGHYVYAELLAHNGNFTRASEEVAKAKGLDPAIKFADPQKFHAFEQLLEREQTPAAQTGSSTTVTRSGPATQAMAPAERASTGIPTWVWGAGLALVAVLLWRGFAASRRAAPAMASNPNYGTPAAAGSYGGAPPYAGGPQGASGTPYGVPPSAVPGGGLLRTGAAVAGGLAAGMLVDELMHRRDQPGSDGLSSLQHGSMFEPAPNNSAANELENRNVDFGNGSDWDAGGGVDPGSSSDDGSGGGWD